MRWYYERILSELSVPTPEAGWLRWLFFAPIPNILTTHVPEAGAFVWSHAQTHQNHHDVPSSVTTLSTFAHYVTYKLCSTSSATRVTLLSPPSIVRIVPHMDIPPNTDQWMTGRWQDKVLSRIVLFLFGTEMLIIQTTRTHHELYLYFLKKIKELACWYNSEESVVFFQRNTMQLHWMTR